jgi:hypothetical protein
MSRFTMFGEVRSLYIRHVESALGTALFVVSSVGSSTRGLESSSEVALESVGRSVLGWVGFIGGGVFPVCVVRGYPIMLRNMHL